MQRGELSSRGPIADARKALMHQLRSYDGPLVQAAVEAYKFAVRTELGEGEMGRTQTMEMAKGVRVRARFRRDTSTLEYLDRLEGECIAKIAEIKARANLRPNFG